MKVLVVQNNAEAAAAIRKGFEGDGHVCIIAESKEMAEVILKSNRFDLVVADYGYNPNEPTVLQMGDLKMNLETHNVERDGKKIDLQPLEYQLLEYMLRHPGRVLSRSVILNKVWNYTVEPLTNVVESCVSRLRTKIDKLSDSKLIKTIKGFGYVIETPAPAPKAPASPQ